MTLKLIIAALCLLFTYQSTTTKEDHENNEGLKPVMFNYSETCSSQVPPLFSSPFFHTDLTTLESLYTACKKIFQTEVDKYFCCFGVSWVHLLITTAISTARISLSLR